MDKKERAIRLVRRDALIDCLKSFSYDKDEGGWEVYTYSESLNSMAHAIRKELERLKRSK